MQRLMRSEGDIANLIASATVWRRIGIIGEESAGVALLGNNGDPETTELQRFLVRNNYPHRVVELPISEVPTEAGSVRRVGANPERKIPSGNRLRWTHVVPPHHCGTRR